MRALAAFAELRLRGASAAGLLWLVPAAFAGGVACARWAPGYDATTRAAAADGVALSACGGLALFAALLLAATAFARDVRTGAVQGLLAPPASRGALLTGGVLGHGAFAALLLLATCLAASLGLDAGGLGTRARRTISPLVAAEILRPGEDGFAVIDAKHRSVHASFTLAEGAGADLGRMLRVHLTPEAQMETGLRDDGVARVMIDFGGSPDGPVVDVPFKAGVPFDAYLPAHGLISGAGYEIVVARVQGHWRLRFPPGSIEVGSGRELFAWNVAKCVACAAPLLLLAAAAGALGSARLGAGAASALVLFLGFLFAGRDVVADGATFIVARAVAQETEPPEEEHDPADEHDHTVHVTPVQAALARGALVALQAVPDASHFWRFGELAQGRAVTPRDVGRAWLHGLPACAVVLAAGWLLLRRREFVPG